MSDELYIYERHHRDFTRDDAPHFRRDNEKQRELLMEKKHEVLTKPADSLAMIALYVAISIGASIAAVAGYDHWFAQKVVAIDIKGYIAKQRDSYLAGSINDEQLRKSFDRLESVINTIPKNRVIIMGDAVVRNAETVTP